jgi:rare lipoprotein A
MRFLSSLLTSLSLEAATAKRVGALVLMVALASVSQSCSSISNAPDGTLLTERVISSESESGEYSDKVPARRYSRESPQSAEVPSSPETEEAPPTEELPEPSRPALMETGLASWYGPRFHGKRTASGEVFNQEKFTAAHPTLPWGSRVKVTNLANGKSVEVRINDRGPFVKDRIIDVSRAAARALGMVKSGVTTVQIEWVDDSETPGQLVLEEQRMR